MPEVDIVPDLDRRFADARQMLADSAEGRRIAILTPGRMTMFQPCPPPGSVAPNMVKPIEQMFPSASPLNIAVIAMTELGAVRANLAKAIPFVGYLLGMGYLGHSVIVFEGHSSALSAACHDADVLLVDSGMIPFLERGWVESARQAMRNFRLLIFGRDGRVQQVVKQV
jgi:hypothetical protein